MYVKLPHATHQKIFFFSAFSLVHGVELLHDWFLCSGAHWVSLLSIESKLSYLEVFGVILYYLSGTTPLCKLKPLHNKIQAASFSATGAFQMGK